MADIFHEVDEEVRRERLHKFWERYSILIIGLAVLIVGGIGAWLAFRESWQGQGIWTGLAVGLAARVPARAVAVESAS